jgi:hypothetical protein
MWMGSNIDRQGITDDLEALKRAGFERTTLFSLADVTTPWAGEIKNSPTPELVAWTEPWWAMVKHATLESKRLGMDFGMFHCPGYEASGGPWITPDKSMQELIFSKTVVVGGTRDVVQLQRPVPDARANMPWPIFNPNSGKVEKPLIPARLTYYKDVAVLAAPEGGLLRSDAVVDLTGRMDSIGRLRWEAPPGRWVVYRFGHTTMGSLIQPAQWAATGLECDKMDPKAVTFHMDHVIGEVRKHLGTLVGNGFSHLHFDSYEAGVPSWTASMRSEFRKRRGYDLLPCLLVFAGMDFSDRKDFRADFDRTIRDLYRDVYFRIIGQKLRKAGLEFLCEPYGGPWKLEEVMPLVDRVMTEFWTNKGVFTPYELEPTIEALRQSGQNIVEAEAFTGRPGDSEWNETPMGLKPIGDAAFCAGVNRLVLHRFTHQPWNQAFKPGMSMGQWGTHFDRTQTWWDAVPGMVGYWKRCQAVLQWGLFAGKDDVKVEVLKGSPIIHSIARRSGHTVVYFLANTSHQPGDVRCSLPTSGLQPEYWDPMTGEMRRLPQFEFVGDHTVLDLRFDDAQSCFVVFRDKVERAGSTVAVNCPDPRNLLQLETPWNVQFDPAWGGPSEAVVFDGLDDWTQRPEPGIRYYSGTAVYSKRFDVPDETRLVANRLSLGVVACVARVELNGRDLGMLWTAPWETVLPGGLLRNKGNELVVRVSNVWANRLIGDHQLPDDCDWLPGHQGGRFLERFPDWFVQGKPRPSKQRFCFTTWDYFTSNSPLVRSGLLGPVSLQQMP